MFWAYLSYFQKQSNFFVKVWQAMRIPRGESCLDAKSVFCIFRKHLSPEAMAKKIAKVFSEAADPRARRQIKISLTDALMSAFAMFTLKVPSLLMFDEIRKNTAQEVNLKNLFGVENIPSDTTMREILDRVDPEQLRPAFKVVFGLLQRGKALESYMFMHGHYLVAIDGTGYFSSDKVHCASCLEKHNKKTGEVTYQHQMLGIVLIHPEKKQVIPLCPEAIIKQDGSSKNDCERNACKRALEKIRADHPKLKIIVTEDGLSSNAPHIRDLRSFGMSFILGAKPGDHAHLFEEFDLSDNRKELVIGEEKGVEHIFTYANDLPLNASSEDVRVNFLNYMEKHPKGKEIRFSWVTDLKLNDETVYKIMRGGRARWKIENETFNTLKNQGYEFEHNYGHGKENLSTVLAYLMMLAFLIDQAQLASSDIVQKALAKLKSLRELYFHIRALFKLCVLENWTQLYEGLAYGMDMTFTIRRPIKNTS